MQGKNIQAVNPYRRKLIEAMVYFAKHVKNPTKTMMYKLLAELDFRHFEQTGLPVTNLAYEAWKRGPVPKSLDTEITVDNDVELPADLAEALDCEKGEWDTKDGEKKPRFVFHSKRAPNLKVFSPRQQKILKEVAEIYQYSTASQASQASHEREMPWAKTVKEKGEGAVIDYLDQLTTKSPVSKEEAREMMEEILAFQKTYNH